MKGNSAMLQLKDIVKKYNTGGTEVEVLKKVNISFRESEFVSILGASGSGKTTLLNIIGGLDKYSSGDMLLMGRSTKEFTDRDWDSYRNGTIGFVFQSYNLIGHLSVIENVKLALSISGESNKENDMKAKKVLEDVGLGEHLYKKPNQLSGGQMQRVAIARALVDEPTGALDSKTSVQIMELIKEISKEKLVIMVTHNPELARKYSDRIVSVKDGEIIEDTIPYIEQEENNGYKLKKTAMAFSSAIKSSFKNLLTKKFRSLMTVVASSIGIISIGLVLAISSGMDKYIQTMQNENLSSMPITISSNQINFGIGEDNNTSDSSEENLVPKSRRDVHKNLYSEDALGNGETFIKYIKENAKDYYSAIDFAKGYQIKALTKNNKGDIVDVKMDGQDNSRGNTIFSVLPEDKNLIMNQFEIVKSLEQNFEYPKGNEVVLFTAKNNEIDKSVLKALGYSENAKVKYEDILGKEFSIVDNNNYYTKIENRFVPVTVDEKMYNAGTKVKVVSIAKAKDSFTSPQFTLGYTKELQDSLLSKEVSSDIVKEQEKDKSKNILTNTKMDNEVATEVLSGLGANTEPSSILIYPKTFNDRDKIADTISEYNKKVAEKYGAGTEDYNKYSITYSDMAKQMTSIMSQMIDTITLILTAFAGISLIVSSIMIGILTYVSVVERTKEIGILRAIGASKHNISQVFNAETFIIGLCSGLLGVGISALLLIPINSIIHSVLNLDTINASLPLSSAIGLIILSMILTIIGGFVPAKKAAKKDPVTALRTE